MKADVRTTWEEKTLGDLIASGEYEIRNNLRQPLSGNVRAGMQGEYPYYGAAGAIDRINDYRFEGMHLLIAEDGTVFSSDNSPMLQLVSGKFWVSNHAHVIRGRTDEVTKRLYYFLRNINIAPYVTGAVQPKLSKENLLRVSFLYPDTEEERKNAVAALISLDQKIELLQRENDTLEQIARALFHEWFIEFNFPNEQSKPYRATGGKMIEGELGEMPEGWTVSTLGKEFEIVMGQSPAGETFNTTGKGVVFFQGRTDFGIRFPSIRLYTTEPTRIAEPSDVLVSVRAPVGDLNVANERCCIGRGLAAIRSKYKSYVLYKTLSVQKAIKAFNSEGTVFGSINKTDLGNIPVIVPPEAIVKSFENAVRGIDAKIMNGFSEGDALASIRDSLLPKLMSGEIRVNEA